MASLDKGLQSLEETAEVFMSVLKSSSAESDARIICEKQQLLFDLHMSSREATTQCLSEIIQAEERLGQKLLDMEEQKKQATQELDSLQQELERCRASSHNTDAELQFLQRELEMLRSSEQEMEVMQQEVEEDTTEIIPSAIYLAQLYHKVTRIKWEHNCEPGVLRGVHYGEDLATPINVDTSRRTKCAVSDYLWGFVSSDW